MQSITGHPERENPFGERVPLHPFNFDRPDLLVETLRDTDTLFNTYWIRVDHGGRTHEQCVQQTRVMFAAARAASVRRIVHISITNPDPESDLPYFRGKGQVEEALRDLEGVSHAILRPTVLYSAEDILLNNIAWTLRKFPAVFLPGRGDYGIQPVFVEDLAELAVRAGEQQENVEVDAVGPEVYSYAMLVKTIRGKIGARCAILPMPSEITYLAGRALGMMLGDIVLTKDEIRGLSRGLLVSKSGRAAPLPHQALRMAGPAREPTGPALRQRGEAPLQLDEWRKYQPSQPSVCQRSGCRQEPEIRGRKTSNLPPTRSSGEGGTARRRKMNQHPRPTEGPGNDDDR